jgi:hypothetical protein
MSLHRHGWGLMGGVRTSHSPPQSTPWGTLSMPLPLRDFDGHAGETARAIHTPAPPLLYTHLGARYPRDLCVESGNSSLQTAPPASIF